VKGMKNKEKSMFYDRKEERKKGKWAGEGEHEIGYDVKILSTSLTSPPPLLEPPLI
jgi:hypothetical protein